MEIVTALKNDHVKPIADFQAGGCSVAGSVLFFDDGGA